MWADPDRGTRSRSLAVAGATGPVHRREAMVRLVLGAHARPADSVEGKTDSDAVLAVQRIQGKKCESACATTFASGNV